MSGRSGTGRGEPAVMSRPHDGGRSDQSASGSSGAPAPPEDPGSEPPGRIRPTHPAALALCLVLGLVGGWLVRPVSLRLGVAEPNVGWAAIGLVWFLGAIVSGSAYLTWRTLHQQHRRLQPHQAVNRLVLGKACALVGAVVAGGYFGFAIAHIGVTDSDLASLRLWHAVAAGVGGLVVMVAALLLEHACRVRQDPE